MSASDILDPHGREFERFLYASVGEDQNGSIVTVLSTLARLDLDPWEEAAELAALGREAARLRLGLRLSKFRDVPELARNHGSVARELARLLPERPVRDATVNGEATNRAALSLGMIGAVLAVLLFVVQMMFVGAPGSGE